jgi:hypothetical protein
MEQQLSGFSSENRNRTKLWKPKQKFAEQKQETGFCRRKRKRYFLGEGVKTEFPLTNALFYTPQYEHS